MDLNWTKNVPNQNGLYWVRNTERKNVNMIHATILDEDYIAIVFMGVEHVLCLKILMLKMNIMDQLIRQKLLVLLHSMEHMK